MQLVSSAGLIPTSARSLPKLKLYEPRTVAEALDALGRAANPVLLSGGTDLVARFNEGLSPGELINLAHVAELRTVSADARYLRIGAAVTHGAGCSHPTVREGAPGFAHAWSRISNPRIRFRATLGGNLMALRPRYEGALLLSAIGAELEFASTAGASKLAAADLWAGRIPPRSLLTAITIDTGGLAWYAYERSMRPLITLAACLRRPVDGGGAGWRLRCAVGTEYLHPALLELNLPGTELREIASAAKDIADQAFTQLPSDFFDPVATRAYCVAAGSVLLARQLAGAERV